MSWSEKHSESERLASLAEHAARSGDTAKAESLYRESAAAETEALLQVPADKVRTLGISAVSAVALWYKGRDLGRAEDTAYQALRNSDLPPFARRQLRDLLGLIWSSIAAADSGVRFVSGDVLVSVRGGQIVHGGAPLDLIVQKVEGIKSVLFRTVEMLLNVPFRSRGAPSAEVQSMFCPWLFQAPAGSYQFAVRVQEPAQMGLWEPDRPRIDRVTGTFFGVLRASCADPEGSLPQIVVDPKYRAAFLSLSRELAPTGRRFETLEVRDAGAPSEPAIQLGTETRQQLNAALRSLRPRTAGEAGEHVVISGVLRAVHLDQDWLEIATPHLPEGHVHVRDASEALDDVVGPMVNRRVRLTGLRRRGTVLYRDIELED